MREREQKLMIEPDADLPAPDELLGGLGDRLGDWAVEVIDQEAVYFDTEDLRLTRAGVSLRYRSDDGWTVKLPESRAGGIFVRQEHTFHGEPGDPPRQASDLVRAWARTSPLGEVAQVHTRRRKLNLFDPLGADVGEIDDDEVTATVTNHTRTHFREIEVEIRESADPRLLGTLVKRLRRAGAGGRRAMPKVARALGDRATEPPDLLGPGRIDRDSTVGELVCATLARSVQSLVEHDPIVRVSEDPEGIHKARVATRRLRSDLRTFRPVLDQTWSEPLRDELKWLGEQLGHVRDADVLMGLLESKAKGLPESRRAATDELLDRLRAMRARDRAALLDALRSDRYLALLDGLVDAARAPRLRSGTASRRASKVGGRLARRPWKRLRKRVRRLPTATTDSDLHDVRKRAKQARYALEAVAPVSGKAAKRAAQRLADLQDVLGDHQDCVVASAWLHEAARDSAGAETAFVAGELSGDFTADKRRRRGDWPQAWKRARTAHRAVGR